MKKIFITLALLLTTIIQVKAYPTKIKAAYAIGIFHNNGNGENIQHKIETKDNYNGTCYSKIVVFSNAGNFISNVKIGNSIGTLIKSTPIYNKLKIKIAQEQTFKHYNVTKGYIEVRINNKLFDSKVFIK